MQMMYDNVLGKPESVLGQETNGAPFELADATRAAWLYNVHDTTASQHREDKLACLCVHA